MIKIDAYLIKCVLAIQLEIAVLWFESYSLNHSRRVVLSPLLSQDIRFKGDWGR